MPSKPPPVHEHHSHTAIPKIPVKKPPVRPAQSKVPVKGPPMHRHTSHTVIEIPDPKNTKSKKDAKQAPKRHVVIEIPDPKHTKTAKDGKQGPRATTHRKDDGASILEQVGIHRKELEPVAKPENPKMEEQKVELWEPKPPSNDRIRKILSSLLGPGPLFKLRRKRADDTDVPCQIGFFPNNRCDYTKYPTYKVLNSEGKVILRASTVERTLRGAKGLLHFLGIQKKELRLEVSGRDEKEGTLFTVHFDPYWNNTQDIGDLRKGKVMSATGQHMGWLDLLQDPHTSDTFHRIRDNQEHDSKVLFNLLFPHSEAGPDRWIDPNMLILQPRVKDKVNFQVGNLRWTAETTLTLPRNMNPRWKALLISLMIIMDLRHYVTSRKTYGGFPTRNAQKAENILLGNLIPFGTDPDQYFSCESMQMLSESEMRKSGQGSKEETMLDGTAPQQRPW